MSSSTHSISRLSAASLESLSVSGDDSRSGVRTANTLSFPRARTECSGNRAVYSTGQPHNGAAAAERLRDRADSRSDVIRDGGRVDVEGGARTCHQRWCSWKLPSRFRTYLVMFAIDSKFSGRRSPSGTLSPKRRSMNSTSSRTPVESMTPASRREASFASCVDVSSKRKIVTKKTGVNPHRYFPRQAQARRVEAKVPAQARRVEAKVPASKYTRRLEVRRACDCSTSTLG